MTIRFILKAVFLALKSKGYEVYAAVDGPEAFSIARRERLDLILLDIFLPPVVAKAEAFLRVFAPWRFENGSVQRWELCQPCAHSSQSLNTPSARVQRST